MLFVDKTRPNLLVQKAIFSTRALRADSVRTLRVRGPSNETTCLYMHINIASSQVVTKSMAVMISCNLEFRKVPSTPIPLVISMRVNVKRHRYTRSKGPKSSRERKQ